MEGILLLGNDIFEKSVQNKMVEKIHKGFLAEILLSIRHYISVNEPAEKLTYKKMSFKALDVCFTFRKIFIYKTISPYM